MSCDRLMGAGSDRTSWLFGGSGSWEFHLVDRRFIFLGRDLNLRPIPTSTQTQDSHFCHVCTERSRGPGGGEGNGPPRFSCNAPCTFSCCLKESSREILPNVPNRTFFFNLSLIIDSTTSVELLLISDRLASSTSGEKECCDISDQAQWQVVTCARSLKVCVPLLEPHWAPSWKTNLLSTFFFSYSA